METGTRSTRLLRRPRLTLLGALGLLAGLAVVPASADHVIPGPPTTTLNVQPQGIHGNPTCSDVTDAGDFLFEFKLEPVTSGTFPLAFDGLTGSVTVTVSDTPQGQAFDFSYTGDFVAATIVVKGGPNANLYDYLAAGFAPGASADTFLHAPVNPNNDRFFGLSHISFCNAEAGAELEIDKTAVADTITVGDHAAFDITVTSLGPGTATNVTIDDELPDAVLDWEVTAEDIADACSITGGNTLHCDVGDLPAGDSFSVRVQTTEPIALGSEKCGERLDNTAFADADNADEVDDDASIDVICGAIQVHKFAKVPGTEDTRAVAGAGFTVFDNDTAIDPPGEVTTGADGIACFDGLPVDTEFRLSETTTPAGYATVDDRTVTSSAEDADCEGLGEPTVVEVENLALTDISWTVSSQVDGGSLTTVECWFGEIDGDPDFTTTVESGSHTFEDLLPTDPDVTLTCQFTVDP